MPEALIPPVQAVSSGDAQRSPLQTGGRAATPAPRKPPRRAPRQAYELFALPQGPWVFRSGRPFGQAGEAGSPAGLAWPLPGHVAGALRNHICASLGYVPGRQDDFIHALHVHGPLACTWAGTEKAFSLWLPAPANARVHVDKTGVEATVRLSPRPWPAGLGADLPAGLVPLWPSGDAGWADLVLPEPVFWRLSALVDWLQQRAGLPAPADRLPLPPMQARVHIALDGERQAKEGHLFINETLHFTAPLATAAHVPRPQLGLWLRLSSPRTGPGVCAALPEAVQALQHGGWRMGADGGTAAWLPADSAQAWRPVDALSHTLAHARGGLLGRRLLLYLATPACFGRNGWYPDGLRPQALGGALEGRLVGFPEGWRFRLEAAAVPGWQAEGSWKHLDIPASQGAGGALPGTGLGSLQRLVPAGSLYWLRVLAVGAPVEWSELMLAPCCRVDHGRDGHGLALYALDTQDNPPSQTLQPSTPTNPDDRA